MMPRADGIEAVAECASARALTGQCLLLSCVLPLSNWVHRAAGVCVFANEAIYIGPVRFLLYLFPASQILSDLRSIKGKSMAILCKFWPRKGCCTPKGQKASILQACGRLKFTPAMLCKVAVLHWLDCREG